MLAKLQSFLGVNRGFKLVWESGRRWSVIGIVVMVLLGVQPVAHLYLSKRIVDLIAEGFTSGEAIAISVLISIICLLAAVEVFGALLRAASTYATAAQENFVQDHVLEKLHDQSLQLDLAYYENPTYYDTLHVAQEEAPTRTAKLVQEIGLILQSGLALVAVAAFLMTYHWGVAFLLVAAVVPGLIVHLKSAERLYRWQVAAAARERRASYFHSIVTGSAPAKELRVFDYGRTFSDWCLDLRKQLRSEKLNIQYWRLTREFFVQFGTVIAQYAGYFYFAYQTVAGVFTLGDMVMFYAAFYRAQLYLRQLLQGITGLYESNLFINSLFELLDLKPSLVSSADAPTPSRESAPIELRGIRFVYPGAKRTALEDISLRIEPGQHVAIVGKNGSGKSTLVKLLCRLYDPTEGVIERDEIDIRTLDLAAYRRRFSVLFQDHMQLDLTVRQNVWLGDRAVEDDERIRRATELSGAADFVESLPNGIETLLGRQFEDGEQLSQGEWQKVALARALVRGAEVTILDEPTSWMDPESEFDFFQRFHELSQGRTVLMISHRLSTVRMADRIVVMERGRILETGTHDELVRRGARYAELFETQASTYR